MPEDYPTNTPFPSQPGTPGGDLAPQLTELANRQNKAMNTIRLAGGGYGAFVTAVHVVGPYGGDTALELQIGGQIQRKQLADFVSEVEGWEENAFMVQNRTQAQIQAARLANIVPLSLQNITVLIY